MKNLELLFFLLTKREKSARIYTENNRDLFPSLSCLSVAKPGIPPIREVAAI